MRGYRFAENLQRGDIIRDLGDGEEVFLYVYDVRVIGHRPGVQIITDNRSTRPGKSKARIIDFSSDTQIVEVQEQDRNEEAV